MAQQLSTLSAHRPAHAQVVAARLDLHTALVSLGAGFLGATILACLSGSVALTPAGLVVHNHHALVLAGAIGLIEAVLTALFKTDALAADADAPPPPLYLEELRLTARRTPTVRVHFRCWETEQLKQMARAQVARDQFARRW